MDRIRLLIRRVAAMFRRSRLDEELQEEIQLHIELRRRALLQEGIEPRNADREARRMFGNVAAIREETRDMWGFPTVEALVQDVRYGARILRRSPVFTVTAVLSLAIGIGASAAVFGLADTVLLRKLPVPRPDDLVRLRWSVPGGALPFESLSGYSAQTDSESSSTSFSFTAFERIRKDTAAALDTFGFADLDRVNVALDGRPETEFAQVVSGNYFSALGVTPAAGRFIGDADDQPGAAPVAVISHDYWQRRFGAAPDTVGRSIVVNNITFTIAGIAREGFHGTLQVGQEPALTLPLAMYGPVTRGEDPLDPQFWWVLMMGRLKPGTSAAGVQPRLDAIVKQTVRYARASIAPEALPRVVVEPGAAGQTEERDSMREPLVAMGFVVGIVLLVACANVSTLLLARGRARRREVAVRVAIGAPRVRIVRQLLTESLLLAVVGSALGLVVAHWLGAALAPALVTRGSFGISIDPGLDWRVLAFTTLLAAACSVAFGLAPALRSTLLQIGPGLQEAGRAAAASRRTRLGASLVVVQVALSMLLLSAAGLLALSLINLQRVSPGFDPHNVLVFGIDPQQNGYDEARVRQTLERALERLRALPGVAGASISSHRLVANSASTSVAVRADEARPAPGSPEAAPFVRSHSAWRLTVDETFLQTMGIPVLRGRGLTAADTGNAPAAAVINEALAKQLFGTSDVVGRAFRFGLHGDTDVHVVGVAANARYSSMRRDPPPTAYLSYHQQPMPSATFEVRATDNVRSLAPSVREAMREVDPTLPLVNLRTEDDQIVESLTEERLFARLATLLGATTLLLAGIGVYGLLAYAVARRTQEIGVRMALGAERSAVRWMILRQSIALAGIGLALGIPAALYSTRVVESMLFGLTARDPFAIGAAGVIMACVAVLAAYVPARRASRVNPIVALRAE